MIATYLFFHSCKLVLEESEKMHGEPATDSPMSLAVVTGFIAMEVKLQNSLTEQNAKFIKVCYCSSFPVIYLSLIRRPLWQKLLHWVNIRVVLT